MPDDAPRPGNATSYGFEVGMWVVCGGPAPDRMRYGQILDVDRSTEVRIRWEPWRDSPTKESWVSASWLRPAPTLLADNQGVKLGDRVYHAVRDVRGTVKTLALRPGYGSEPYLTVIPDAVIPDGRGDESRVWTLRNLYMSQHAENIT